VVRDLGFVDVDADTARHPSTGPEREELDSVDSPEVRARRIRNLYRDGMKYENPVAGRMMRRPGGGELDIVQLGGKGSLFSSRNRGSLETLATLDVPKLTFVNARVGSDARVRNSPNSFLDSGTRSPSIHTSRASGSSSSAPIRTRPRRWRVCVRRSTAAMRLRNSA
jgi:hypothetical protein